MNGRNQGVSSNRGNDHLFSKEQWGGGGGGGEEEGGQLFDR